LACTTRDLQKRILIASSLDGSVLRYAGRLRRIHSPTDTFDGDRFETIDGAPAVVVTFTNRPGRKVLAEDGSILPKTMTVAVGPSRTTLPVVVTCGI
jgi:hypothetical protein